MKISYCVLGTNDRAAATSFYDALFALKGITQVAATDRMTYWQTPDFAFAVATPFDEQPATHGNGTMVGFCVGTKDDVKAFHQKALDLGGTCEGQPGERGPFYSAYVRDLDHNKLCFFADFA
ncbi:VOC family protein [Woodsholea maritima]|uniref:VOC family protein n=1 Tax=Woodsholea maritima TaxID=240237 RepID=UPI00037D76AB|nr:VOC family protein [Woodsholea maritima]